MICGIMANQCGASACAYPLDATLADLIALEIPNKLTASVDQQTGSYIQQSISYQAGLTVAGGPATTSPMLLGAGQKAFRFILSATPQVDAGIYSGTAMAMFAAIISPALDNLCQITMQARKNGEFELVLLLGLSPVLTLTNRASGVAVCDLMFDAVTGEVTFWLDNVQQALTSNTYTPGNAFVAIYIEEGENAAGNTGSLASIEMVTDLALMTGTAFPPGTTDICGTPL